MTIAEARKITLSHLQRARDAGERFTCLTAYDAGFARILDDAGVEVILVGDSLGMVVQGWDSTLPVSMDHMVYHAAMVSRATRRALVMVDMPFMSFATPEQALTNAARLMAEGGAQMVKLEGTARQAEVVARLTDNGVPVCAHLGLRPQFVHKLGGYRVQGRNDETAAAMIEDARALEQAGADVLLVESVPSSLAVALRGAVSAPVIGIGAGPSCDAQVLVLYDLLGITPGRIPRFAKDYLADGGTIRQAVARYVADVRGGRFPDADHSFD
ncbi:MAG: 3-methyl-2-oxobutanoate hydroxymethyltransferase [Gammaproteobacteria bacterium]|nr:3-methyl-2-oxobutanoate hydroxymethyltransferase [Gammaproteobacteria bacterium]